MREDTDRQDRKNRRRKRKNARRARHLVIGLLCLLILAVAGGGLAWMKLGGADAMRPSGEVVSDSKTPETPESIEETTQPESTEAPEPVVKTLTLTAVGDCALGKERKHGYSGSFNSYYDKNGPTYFFDNVRSIFEADDMTIVNLECALTTATERRVKEYNLKGDPSYVEIMTCSSVEMAVLGNNHSGDYKEAGLQETKDTLDGADIAWALDSEIGYYTTGEGLKVAVISREVVGASKKTQQVMLDDVKRAREQEDVDLVIACCHWGSEKKYYPSAGQKNLAHDLVDAGADLVIGHHPHVLQGIELYNGKVICYSLGNFSFGGNRKSFDYRTAIYQQTFTFVDGELQNDLAAKMIPARTSSVGWRNDFQPVIAEGTKKEKIISLLNSCSKNLSDLIVADDGALQRKSDTEESA